LLSYFPDYRYPLFWQGLESLFGADNERSGITKRLCDRISFFLANTPAVQKELSDKVRGYYGMRSEIVHGRWEDGPKIELLMDHTEGIVRTVVRHIVDKPGILCAFVSPKRDEFLEAWARSQSFVPPPFP
jgi:Apea-like HEPN